MNVYTIAFGTIILGLLALVWIFRIVPILNNIIATRPFAFRFEEEFDSKSYKRSRTFMAMVISIIVLGSALYILLSKGFDSDSEKWAIGAIGTIVGFWLKE
jgi:hypothetical protein